MKFPKSFENADNPGYYDYNASEVDAWCEWLRKEVASIQGKRRKWSVSPMETTGDMLRLMDELEMTLK